MILIVMLSLINDGQTTLRSIGAIAKLQSIKDNDGAFVAPLDMLSELEQDNKAFAASQR